jgi:hypothetical protein
MARLNEDSFALGLTQAKEFLFLGLWSVRVRARLGPLAHASGSDAKRAG